MTELNAKIVNIDTVMEKEMVKLNEVKTGIKKIFSQNMAFDLIEMGVRPFATEPNHKKQGFVVFIFKQTDALEEAMTALHERKGK